MMKIKNKKKNIKMKIAATLVAALIAVAGVAYALWALQKSAEITEDTSANNDTTVTEDRTYSTTSENEEITVPDNVDPSSIKDYTLITENETYKIRELNDEYYITLYAIINRPDQADMYHDQLRMYKQDALNYLNSQGVDTANKKIYYEPAEATNL